MTAVLRAIRVVRNVGLTLGAGLGLLAVAAGLAAVVFGARPVVITSGSMGPAIGTGDLVLTRSVSADDLRVGDVVTVSTSTRSRVTHRVTALDDGADGTTVLTLKGDANEAPDAEVYPVSTADRMVARIPRAGYVLMALRTPVGMVTLGALATALLIFVLTGGRPPTGGPDGRPTHRHRAARSRRRRTPIAVGAAGPVACVVALAGPSAAAWTDPVDVSGTTVGAHTVVRPASASCSAALLSATVSWPGDARYDYEVVLRRVSNGNVVSTSQVTGSGASITYSGLASFGLVVGAGTVDFQVEIRSYLANTTSWRSSEVRTYGNIRVVAVVIGATVSCTT